MQKQLPEIVVSVRKASKAYHIFDTPRDRLKQLISSAIARATGSDARKYYHEFWALQNVSFDLFRGETIGVIGRNGAGKSTLLQLICGTLVPTSGEIEIQGRIAGLLELGAGFNPELSGRDNVFFGGQVLGMSIKQIEKRYDQIQEFADIGDFIDRPVKMYSTGMYVRLAFSLAVHVEPEILVIDEALGVGDFLFQQKCSRFIRERLAGTTKLLVSHDLPSISSLADRTIVLSKGQLVFEGETKKAIECYQRVARAEQFHEGTRAEVEQKQQPAMYGDRLSMDDDAAVELLPDQLSGRLVTRIARFQWWVAGQTGVSYVRDGECVAIRFELSCDEDLLEPVVGYQVQDRFGAVMFGDNSITSQLAAAPLKCGRHIGHIELVWPLIAPGKYSLTIGIGDGNDAHRHVIECWAHNIIILENSPLKLVHGIFNAQLTKIVFDNE